MDVFGSSGVRGIVGEDITPSFVGQVAAAAGAVLGSETVAVARDTRTTGEMLADAAASTLAGVGCSVHRLGVVPTPGVQAYAERRGVPAVMITASHNPPAYNGVKLVGDDGVELSAGTLEAIEGRLAAGVDPVGYADTGASERVDGTNRAYIEALLGEFDGLRDRIADAEVTVALDPGHGAGCLTSPGFLRRLGCRVVTLNAQPDGRFPGRDPEPVEGNLADLRRLVRSCDADLGIAHDGDADRAIFVDETGDHVDGDASFAALAASELGEDDAVVSAVNVSQRVVDVVAEAGADLELTPIGSTHLITRTRELLAGGANVPIAGEGNGGIFFPGYRIARDGAYTAARFIGLVAERTASGVAADHGGYAMVRRNLEYDGDDERAAMLEAAGAYAEAADAELTTIDGYRLDYGDAWVLARPSGTEPLVRLYAEARHRERAEAIIGALGEEMRRGRSAG
jgi:phosphomannomutase/phosphoglucomutase